MQMLTTGLVKERLRQYGECARELADLAERRGVLRARAISPKASNLDGMPHSEGFSSDRLGALMGQLEQIDHEVESKKAETKRLYHDLDAYIGRIKAARRRGWPDRRAVLQMRYLDLASWSETAAMLFSQKADFEDRQESYLRRTHRIHAEALMELAELDTAETETAGQDNAIEMEDRK